MKELGVWARDDDTEDGANYRGHSVSELQIWRGVVRRWKKGTEGMEKGREETVKGGRETIYTSILGTTGVVLDC